MRGDDKPGTQEMKVIDFQSQQRRLFPLLAAAYAIHSGAELLQRLYSQVQEEMKGANFENLPDLHATSSGMKAYSSWAASNGIDECRQRCGGNRYSHFSGLPDLFQEITPACTYEGDNIV